MVKFRKLIAACLFSLSVFAVSAEELVIKVEIDSQSAASLDTNAKTYMSSAYSRFLQDVLSVPQISVRNSSVDENLQAIQLKSQIEAATGMGSDEAAYATDKGSRAELSLLMKMNKLSQSSWQLVCELSEIETKKLVATVLTDKLPLTSVTSDECVDKLAYNTLLAMQMRSYISSIPASVVSQLQHTENSAAAYQKYLQDYTSQIEEIEKEKARLESQAKTAEEKAEAEQRALALQLKIDMLEKSRQQAEAALRRQQENEANEAKKRSQMEELSQNQRDKINDEIKVLEKKRTELRNAVVQQMSLKKRIELIESDRTNLSQLEKLYSQSVEKIQHEYDAACEEKIKAKQNEPWGKGETDANGNPTQMAKKFRNQDIAEIRTNYTKLKNDAVAELKKSVQPNLDSYKKQLDLNVSELQKTTYVFRSIDASDDYLSLNVDDYDGNTCSWTVHSAFKANDIVKFDASKLDSLPDTEISYEIMTGKKPATLASTKEDYREYLNLVERADLYFRVSVPYLYSQLAVKVTYDSVTDRYIAVPENFKIFKMENNSKALVEYKGSYFVAAEKREAEEARAEEIRMVQEETRRVQEEEQSRKKRERAATEEKYRQLIRAKLNAQRDFGRAMWANTDIVFNNLGVSIGGSLGITYPILGGLFVGADVGGYMSADEEASYGDMGITGTVDVGINFLFDASSSAGWYVKAGIGGAYGYPTGDGLMYRAAVGARYYGVGLEYSLDYVKDSLAADRLSLFYVFSF